ncbi:MAG TPA: metal-dependent hydrolase [Terrimesophilobacter sp.]|nr:metal-dependent hydrolase [Terrimesophilobacter sp.]
MTLPINDTVVTYPTGATSGTATVLHVEKIGDVFAVLLDTTPVHPVDAGWPDQPADRASFEWNGGRADVTDCLVAATDGETLALGAEIPVRKGAEGWAFVAAHVVTEAPPDGMVVTVDVDDKFRRALSIGHTGCHLASLALNRALADRWAKTVREDALGSPNFDAEANDVSRILENGSRDTYRLGKSLRKKGFRTDGFADGLAAVEDAINASLQSWVGAKLPVRIDRDGDRLTDRRYWVCEFPEGAARIPCGGTHANDLGELKGLTARLSLEDHEGTPVLVMETTSA